MRPEVSQKNAKVSTSPPTVQRSHRNTSLSSAFPTAETHASGRCVPTSTKNLGEFPPLQPRCKGPTVTPRFPHPSLQRRHAPLGGASSLLPNFWGVSNSATTIQRSHGNTSLPETSLQKRHLPLCVASPLHTHRIASVSTFPTTIQKSHASSAFSTAETRACGRCVPTSPKKLQKKNPPLHPRCEGPTVTPRFLSLLHSGDTRVFGRCVLTSTQHLREFPLLQPQFKSPTVSPRFLCLSLSRDTRLWAVRPNFNQKSGRVSTFPTTIQSSHRNTSLPQPSPQRRHAPLGGESPLLPKNCETSDLCNHITKGPTGTPRFLSFTWQPRHAPLGGASKLQTKICECFHLSNHDSEVPP